MREDVKRFRIIASSLISGKKMKRADLLKELGVSPPTYDKIIVEDLDKVRIKASVLGKIQDFNKKHNIEELDNYPPHKSDKVSEKELDNAVEVARELIDDKPPICADKTIWSMLRDLEKALPKNMSIQLLIHSRKV